MNYETLKSGVESGKTTRQLAEELDTSQTNVRYWLKKHSITVPKKEKYVLKNRKQNYLCSCGQDDPSKFYGEKSKCGECHKNYTKNIARETRRKIIAHLGGKCSNCGFDKYVSALDVHHTDPSLKDKNFKSIRGWCWPRIEEELKTCKLMCRNCHAALHNGELIE